MYQFNHITLEDVLAFLDNAPNNLSKQPISEESIDEIKKSVKVWESETKEFLTQSILPDANLFIKILTDRSSYIFEDFLLQKSSHYIEKFQHLQNQVKRVKDNIQLVKKYILACDGLTGTQSDKITLTDEKFSYVLKILNLFIDETFHSVQDIFDLNNVVLRNGEAVEIAVELKRKGYVMVDDHPYRDNIKITVKGSAHIERKLKQRKTTSRRSTVLDARLNEVIDHLRKLGYGQEIIFKELEEMRSHQDKLSKKSWAQMLKGKLIDLALTQVINKKLATEVFTYLTDLGVKLVK